MNTVKTEIFNPSKVFIVKMVDGLDYVVTGNLKNIGFMLATDPAAMDAAIEYKANTPEDTGFKIYKKVKRSGIEFVSSRAPSKCEQFPAFKDEVVYADFDGSGEWA